MARRSGLGRGLDALIPAGTGRSTGSALREVPLSHIRPNPYQPRKQFDEQSLSTLVDSIRAIGVLQPVLVREVGEGEFELIAGERRWRASRRAGLTSIPALVQVADDVASLEQALVENLHREDLNALDEAAAYQQLIEEFHLTHEEVARRVGKSRASVSNALRLFQLPPSVQRLVRDAKLSPGHARALLTSPDRDLQERLARDAVERGLSVRAVEDLVRFDMQDEPPDESTGAGPGDGADPAGGDGSAAGEGSGAADGRRPAEVGVGGAASGAEGGVEDTPSAASGPASGGRAADGAADGRRRLASRERRDRPTGVLELEELLADHLDTRVRVDMGSHRGRIVVEFATLEDLERIYRAMLGERHL
ncbi:MAG: ParB/RepB/Spo0J family partition protein [Actinomycetota bacterium]|nr:ParB/RepB/Spo0J family partition protein [Actinomycetota bacterium]